MFKNVRFTDAGNLFLEKPLLRYYYYLKDASVVL